MCVSSTEFNELQHVIGYTFKDVSLLTEAITHASSETIAGKNYERLEFLGDAFINLIIADYFFTQYPDYTEGNLTQMKSHVVNGSSLAGLGKNIGLEKYILIGKSISRDNIPESILCDAVEALCAAVFLDAGVRYAREFVLNLFRDKIEEASSSQKDAKSRLQEIIQKQSAEMPVYEVVDISQNNNERIFSSTVKVCGIVFGPCEGKNKKQAEQSAALLALKALID
jgi:ribonuclease-3